MDERLIENDKIHEGLNVAFARNIKGFSQEDLGIIIGYSTSRVSQLEKQKIIDEEILDKISKALNTDKNWFKTFTLEQNPEEKITTNAESQAFTNTSAENSHETTSVTQKNTDEDLDIITHDRLLLCAVRNYKGYNQEECGKILGLSQKEISDAEQKETLDPQFLTKVETAFNLKPNFFKTFKIPRYKNEDGTGNKQKNNIAEKNELIALLYKKIKELEQKIKELEK